LNLLSFIFLLRRQLGYVETVGNTCRLISAALQLDCDSYLWAHDVPDFFGSDDMAIIGVVWGSLYLGVWIPQNRMQIYRKPITPLLRKMEVKI
jgi:hypothetical protein